MFDADWNTADKLVVAMLSCKLKLMMMELGQMNPSDRAIKLQDKKLDHRTFLETMRSLWAAAKHNNTYPPAMNAPDRRAAPSQFGANTLFPQTPGNRDIASQHRNARDGGRNGGAGGGGGRGGGRGSGRGGGAGRGRGVVIYDAKPSLTLLTIH